MTAIKAAILIALLHAPLASAQGFETPPSEGSSGNEFQCANGGTLQMRLGTRGREPVAAVSTGGTRHVLELQPWDGLTPHIVWSDGLHTLTWSAGVRLMWMDGASHLACGRRLLRRDLE